MSWRVALWAQRKKYLMNWFCFWMPEIPCHAYWTMSSACLGCSQHLFVAVYFYSVRDDVYGRMTSQASDVKLVFAMQLLLQSRSKGPWLIPISSWLLSSKRPILLRWSILRRQAACLTVSQESKPILQSCLQHHFRRVSTQLSWFASPKRRGCVWKNSDGATRCYHFMARSWIHSTSTYWPDFAYVKKLQLGKIFRARRSGVSMLGVQHMVSRCCAHSAWKLMCAHKSIKQCSATNLHAWKGETKLLVASQKSHSPDLVYTWKWTGIVLSSLKYWKLDRSSCLI